MNSFEHKYLIIDTSILCVWLEMPEFKNVAPMMIVGTLNELMTK